LRRVIDLLAEVRIGGVADEGNGQLFAPGLLIDFGRDLRDDVAAVGQTESRNAAVGQLDRRRLPDAAPRPRDHRHFSLDLHGALLDLRKIRNCASATSFSTTPACHFTVFCANAKFSS
jgi:hypothetical protein